MVTVESENAVLKKYELDSEHSLRLTDNTKACTTFNAKHELQKNEEKWMKILKNNPHLKIAVIGGGIYGCHLSYVFMKAAEKLSSERKRNIDARITLFEKDAELFSQASGKNSFRIHKGYHYPRSGNTRKMCFNDQCKFRELYPNLYQTLPDGQTPTFPKVFAIANDENTKLDYEALRNLLVGAEYSQGKTMWDEVIGELWSEDIRLSEDLREEKEQQMKDLGFNPELIDGAFVIQEEPILYADKPRRWFTEQLEKSPFVKLMMNTKVTRDDVLTDVASKIVVHEELFDFVCNCSYNQAVPMYLENHSTFYDLFISVIVAEKPQNGGMPAISFSIFDGPYPSLEPYDFADKDNLPDEIKEFKDHKLYQIFDVKLSSVSRVPNIAQRKKDDCERDNNIEEAYRLMAEWELKKKEGHPDYKNAVQRVLNSCKRYYPKIEKDFVFAGSWFALKTKVEDVNATRPLIVVPDKDIDRKGRFIQVFSAKLTSIFGSEEEILEIIECASSGQVRKESHRMSSVVE